MAAHRKKTAFENKNSAWLNSELEFSGQPYRVQESSGRLSTEFLASSERSKIRKCGQFRSDRSDEELTYAAQMQYRSEGNREAAEVLKNVAILILLKMRMMNNI